jgi:hypothetical protein
MDEKAEPQGQASDRQPTRVNLFRYEGVDLVNGKILVSCPDCFSLSRFPLQDACELSLQCEHCPTQTAIAYNAEDRGQWEKFMDDRPKDQQTDTVVEIDTIDGSQIAAKTSGTLVLHPAAFNGRELPDITVDDFAEEPDVYAQSQARELRAKERTLGDAFRDRLDAGDDELRKQLLREVVLVDPKSVKWEPPSVTFHFDADGFNRRLREEILKRESEALLNGPQIMEGSGAFDYRTASEKQAEFFARDRERRFKDSQAADVRFRNQFLRHVPAAVMTGEQVTAIELLEKINERE